MAVETTFEYFDGKMYSILSMVLCQVEVQNDYFCVPCCSLSQCFVSLLLFFKLLVFAAGFIQERFQ